MSKTEILPNRQSSISRRRAIQIGGAAALIAGAAPARAQATKKYDAIVVGAGLSGLHAAMILEEAGLDILVLEGRQRIGGRVYTLMNIPGKPEAAGEFIGPNYARMLDTAQRLNLTLIGPDQIAPSSKRYYRINGEAFTAKEWEGHKLNVLPDKYRHFTPDQLLSKLSHINNPLYKKPLDDWLKPEYYKYDIPHSQYLREYLNLSEPIIELMNTTIHSDHIDNTSAMNELRRYAVNAFNSDMGNANPDKPSWMMIKGGNSLMPAAMAETLNNEILLGKTVHGFDDAGDYVGVHCLDGTSYQARQVVCSMPHSVLRDVKFTKRLDPLKRESIKDINYGISIQVHFAIKKPFWEQDGLPMSIWGTDSFERFAVIRRGENGTPSSAIAFVNGNDAFKYNFLSDAQAYKYTIGELVIARPSLKGALEGIMVQSCHRNVHGSGDWVFWAPGQVEKYANHMRDRHGNVHFAGEHTAIMERGMEGAFESGERAALDLLERA